MPLDLTHDPDRTSWVASANQPGSDFPIQNLPFGVFEGEQGGRIGVAIGDQILDLAACYQHGLLAGLDQELVNACLAPTLSWLMALGRPAATQVRRAVSDTLVASNTAAAALAASLLVEQQHVRMRLPAHIGDYTDFYASIHHATNVGRMLRPDNPLMPNYKHLPVGYHGRASSIVVSPTPVRRPRGQVLADGALAPSFEVSKTLDYELEVGILVGQGNPLGEPFALDAAEDHIFGLCLLNDWSARDLQKWEYQPLGPFLAKSFATSISPWVITLDALEPFRAPRLAREADDPALLPHLDSERDQQRGAVEVELSVLLSTPAMRDAGLPAVVISSSNFKNLYWTMGQMLTHHVSNGCNMRPGDLLGSGTVSGPTQGERGCLLELTWRGSEPLVLPNGEVRRFLHDGDEVSLVGRCAREGAVALGFGSCRGLVLEALPAAALA
jgi:fumarylacetoacetase